MRVEIDLMMTLLTMLRNGMLNGVGHVCVGVLSGEGGVQPNLRAGQPAGKDPPEMPYLWLQGCSPGNKLLLALPVTALKRKRVAIMPIYQCKAHCFVLGGDVIPIWLWYRATITDIGSKYFCSFPIKNGLAGVECFRFALKIMPLDVADYSCCIRVWLLDSPFGVVPSLKEQQTLENFQQNTHGITFACVLSCIFEVGEMESWSKRT